MEPDQYIKKIRAWGIFGAVIGVIFVLIGLLGLVLPIIPGILFLIIGLLVLGVDLSFIMRFLKKRK
ncbi:MAG: hypothetical protein ACP5NW_04915 [Candidatus Woesearchaeota archaeon]